MKDLLDRSAPGVRISAVPSLRATGGAPIDLTGRIISFSFEDSEKKADKATLELDNNDLSLFERPELAGGALWDVSWGYPGAMTPPRRVVVRKMTGFQTLTLEGHALSVLLNQEVKSRTFQDKTIGQIAGLFAQELGYLGRFVNIDVSGQTIATVAQAGETTARFLRRLASRDERIFSIDEKGFHFRRRQPAPTVRHVYTWHNDNRGQITSINVESNLSARVGSVAVRGRDPMKKTTVTGQADKDSVDRETIAKISEVVPKEKGKTYTFIEFVNQMSTQHPSPPTTKEGAKRNADARFRKAEGDTVKLNMSVVGDPTLEAGHLIELRGIGRRLSGIYHAIEVKHAVAGAGYTCDLKLRRDGFSTAIADGKVRHGQPQGGQHSKAKPAEPGALELVEFVLKEAGPTITLYTRGTKPLGEGDPEAKKQ